ncbi:hypothetical protein SH449x_002544 [Pirellulaceae bacterium SH449]
MCVLVCVGVRTEAGDASTVIARSVVVFEKQRAINLPVGVAFVARMSQKVGNQNLEETNISVLLNESGTGIDASYRKDNRSNKSHFSVAIVNSDYGAVADRKNTNALRSSFMLSSLDKQGFSLDTYWKNDEPAGIWLQETIKMKLSSRYFNLEMQTSRSRSGIGRDEMAKWILKKE